MSRDGQIPGEFFGQVVHKRQVSKKICFLDIILEHSDDSKDQTGRNTVILKSWIAGAEVMAKALKGPEKIHCGDWVRFQGDILDDNEMTAKTFQVVKRWSVEKPGSHFQPIPPENKSEKQRSKTVSGGVGKSDKSEEDHPVCKFWLNTGHCPKKRKQLLDSQAAAAADQAAEVPSCCPFSHPEPSQELSERRLEYVRERLEKRKKLQLNSSGHEGHEDGEEGSCLASRHQRASIFADWILGKRRSDLSSPDHIILDVAGGRKCEVGFELKIKRFREVKAEVICIDPRAAESKRPKWKSKIMKKVMEKNNVGEDQHAVELKHMQAMFNKDLLDKLRHDDQGGQVRLILGMHPDEATEPIVDLALKNGISFAIVPCCVFAHSNPERRLKSSGEEPRTYQQFCDYLMEKDPAIQSDCLGFRGRDRVLYRFFLDGS